MVMAPSVGLAQEDQRHSRAEKVGAPGRVHDRLNRLAGTWDVEVRYKLGGEEHKGTATCEANRILDGRFLQQEYKSRFQDKSFHVMQLLGYDNARKKTIEIMMDTMSTGVLHNEGSISDDGKVITNVGESVDQKSGKPYKLRTVTTIVDGDHFTLAWFRTDPGDMEQNIVTMSHTRRKS
jgi:hypothetical protein